MQKRNDLAPALEVQALVLAPIRLHGEPHGKGPAWRESIACARGHLARKESKRDSVQLMDYVGCQVQVGQLGCLGYPLHVFIFK